MQLFVVFVAVVHAVVVVVDVAVVLAVVVELKCITNKVYVILL